MLFDTYEHDEALKIAADVTPRLEASGDVFDLIMVHSVRARVLALRGQGEAMVAVLDWLESAGRGTEDPQAGRRRSWSVRVGTRGSRPRRSCR